MVTVAVEAAALLTAAAADTVAAGEVTAASAAAVAAAVVHHQQSLVPVGVFVRGPAAAISIRCSHMRVLQQQNHNTQCYATTAWTCQVMV